MPQDFIDAPLSDADLKAVYTDAPIADQNVGGDPNRDALLQNIKNLSMGALKKAARIGQIVPGVAAATDKVYGFQPGTSEKATQPANGGEKIGGLAAEAALLMAGGMADAPGARAGLSPKVTVTGVKNVAQATGGAIANAADTMTEPIARVSHYALKGAWESLIGKGPVTEERVATAAGKWGVNAVKAALGLAGIKWAFNK